MVAAIRRQLPPGADPGDLVFTGPGGGVVARGTRTVLSRHNFRRTYHSAVTKLADPATELRPTAARVLKALLTDGPRTTDELVVALANQGRGIRPATVEAALGELAAARLVAADDGGQARRFSALTPAGDPLLDAVDVRGAHDFRHTFATRLEDAGIPARVIDELMGHEANTHGARHLGSAMGAHYRHTTPEMAARVTAAIQARLAVVVRTAEETLEAHPTRCHATCSNDCVPWFLANLWQMAVRSSPGMQQAGCHTRPGLRCWVEPLGGSTSKGNRHAP